MSQSIAGFDFGTSNCAVGIMQDQQAQLVALPEHGNYMSSTLFAPQSEMICGWLYQQLEQQGKAERYKQARVNQLSASLRSIKELKLDGYDEHLSFGQQALKEYLIDPADCYYVRSPKSFLGASGIRERQQQQFEDIAAAMMWHIAEQVKQTGQAELEKVVIGRPVNFQGLNSDLSNQQAISILNNAASFAGFKQVEFLFEPMAAGLSYQQQLSEEKRVLVIDIGGGTSDVSMLVMGPDYLAIRDHNNLVLGYNGERIGGNDFDIALNFETLMPSLGAKLHLASGQPMPIKPFWDAAAINDFPAQTRFYEKDTRLLLQRLLKEPQLSPLKGLLRLSDERLTYQMSASAEQAKIALSSSEKSVVDLSYLAEQLEVTVEQTAYQQAAERLLNSIAMLSDDVITQAACQPDAIFLTGGSANSPMIKNFLAQRYQAPLVSGDNFGSVTSGLTLWANHIFS
ncbi:molecular chaperone [Agarivorans sp. Toyoura001]|uniref:molecular chaperone n=1 Tax=Agarivorans sp. Toyoura001 TaxID=2283141 RepID=UPI0010DD1E4B|nr:molecular chaperone [Agarivorans sp. Toyoura001]GDY26931.1 molecular chaperone [Agarivorans sp. Toyoura001]